MPLDPRAMAIAEEITAIRRDLHAHPEIAFEERRTGDLVARRLEEWGIDANRHYGRTGVVGLLKGKRGEGKRILLRADMDALPITENTGLPWQSTVPGKAHACGHDGHTAMLLGAAKLLAEDPDFAGEVLFCFQPAEEGHGGAKVMIEDGLLRAFPVDSVWGMHNANLPIGEMVVRSGASMSATDELIIDLYGTGSHAAEPHKSADPVLTACHVVTALQSLVSRNVDPLDSAVISVCIIQAGEVRNAIPPSARLRGTIRSLRPETRDMLHANICRMAEQVAAGFGVRAEVTINQGYPPLINHADSAEIAASVAATVMGADKVRRDSPPSMGGEDFAFFLQEVPGCYVWLGAKEREDQAGFHQPYFDFNDNAIPFGVSYWLALVKTILL